MFKVKRKRKRRRSWWRWWREKKTKRRNEQMNERYNKYTCSTVHTYVHRVETYREKQVWRRWMKIIINHCRCLNTHFFLNFFFFCRSFYSTQWCCFSSSFWLAHLEIQSKLFMNILFFAQEIFFSFSWIFFPFLLQNRFDSITHLNPSHHLNTIPILNTAVVFVWRVNRVCWILERSWLDWREADEQFFLAYQTKTPARMYTLILSFQPSPSYCYTSLESWDVWKWNGNFDIFLLQMKNCWRLEICAILYSTQRNIQGNWNEFKSAP